MHKYNNSIKNLKLIQGNHITNEDSKILNKLNLHELVMRNLNNISRIYISKELNLQIFACLSYNEVDYYGLLNFLEFTPKSDMIKM